MDERVPSDTAEAGTTRPASAPDGPDSASPQPPSGRRWLPIAGTVVVLAIGGVVAARTVDLGAAVDAVRGADPLLLAAAVAVYTVSWPLRGRRYGDVLAPMDRRVRSGFLTSAVLLSQTANLAIPARGGDAVRALVLKRRRDVAYATGVASLAVERVFDLLAIAALGAVAVLAMVLAGEGVPLLAALRGIGVSAPAPGVLAVGGILGGAAAALGARWLARRPDGAVGLLPARFRAGLRTARRNLAVFLRRPRSLAAVGAGSLAIWALDALTAVLVLAAVADAGVGSLVAVGTLAVCAGNLAKVLPLTQGGIGLYEGAFAATVTTLAPVAGATALAAAVLDHALKNGVTLAGGGVAGLLLHTDALAARSSPETDSERAAGSGVESDPS